jgi:hypothetical protein
MNQAGEAAIASEVGGVDRRDGAEAAGAADAAWVAIETPLSADDLLAFLNDVERLLRINPLYVVSQFAVLGGGRYRLGLHNLSNDRAGTIEITASRRADGLDLRYSEGLKSATTFRVEPGLNGGSRLVVTDTYAGASEEERARRLGEVDRSLTTWGRALHGYLRMWARWRWLAPWRWYMARVWQPMTPSARRVVFLILAISAFDVVALGALGLVLMLTRQFGPAP